MLDEIFGASNFKNEIVWWYSGWNKVLTKSFEKRHDNILFYTKGGKQESEDPRDKNFNSFCIPYANKDEYLASRKQKSYIDEDGREYTLDSRDGGNRQTKVYVDVAMKRGKPVDDVWQVDKVNNSSLDKINYPTQKPDPLLERIIKASSNEGDLVFDCFMGSGTTQAVAMKLGRRFIGADINLGAVQITTKRLLGVAEELEQKKNSAKSLQLSIPKVSPKLRAIEGGKATEPAITKRAAEKGTGYVTSQDIEPSDESVEEFQTDEITTYYTGFEVYNVNHYDVFRNPLEAKDLLLEALEIQRLDQGNLFDGEKDGRMVKIMPVNRIATKADLSEIIAGLDYKKFERVQKDSKHKPTEPLEKITLVCMGHEPDLKATLEEQVKPFKIDVEVVDILRDKSNLEFKRDSEAKIKIDGDYLIIDKFYPMNLLQKLSLQQENVEDWRELVESVMIDWNYDSGIFEPKLVDIPDKKELVSGRYKIPEDAGTIRVKITDLLSESWEGETYHG